MIGRVNTGGGGSGGTLTVTAPANVTVSVSKDGKTKTRTADSSGVAVFKGLASGTWTVTITGDGKTAQKTVSITTDYSVLISFNTIPEFTYTGDYEIVSDDDQPITVSQGNWKIRFLTSGTLIFTNLNGAEDGIDVFLVGGGGSGGSGVWDQGYVQKDIRGGGGAGGYTKTISAIQVALNTRYDIIVGAGGVAPINSSAGVDGGNTSAFSTTANGGGGTQRTNNNGNLGGNGGSGGGNALYAGATDGGGGTNAGTGQGTTTREFGESDGKLYATGGSGIDKASGAANTGDGGSGGKYADSSGGKIASGGNGASGIVIIRNAREAA